MGGLNLRYAGPPTGGAEIILPASKSISNRLLVMQALCHGALELSNLSEAEDTQLLKQALAVQDGEMWLGHAGTALRFGLAWASITRGTRILKGSARLMERPIAPLVEALRQLGAQISYLEKEGFAPLKVIGGPLSGGTLHVSAQYSSQFITALLLIGPYCQKGIHLHLKDKLVSEPYIDLTIALMQQGGAKLRRLGNEIVVSPGAYSLQSFDIEPDWSAAAFFYSFASLEPRAEILLSRLSSQSLQGDRVCANLFSELGVQTIQTPSGIRIKGGGAMGHCAEVDLIHCPDLAQPLAVSYAALGKPVVLQGLDTLESKETNRITALVKELGKLGYEVRSVTNAIEITGKHRETDNRVIETYQDHRMAMSFAPMAIRHPGLSILQPDVVQKSFPHFWREIEKLGILPD